MDGTSTLSKDHNVTFSILPCHGVRVYKGRNALMEELHGSLSPYLSTEYISGDSTLRAGMTLTISIEHTYIPMGWLYDEFLTSHVELSDTDS